VSFVDQILQRALDQDRVEAIADKVSVPTYTLDAARLLRPLVDDRSVDGVVHLCNAGACTWQEYGQHAIDCAEALGLPLHAHKVEPLALTEMKSFIARRPVYTAMSTDKLTSVTGLKPRPWQEAVEDYVRTHWLRHVSDHPAR
jgi:dTDP-4-dehydrorhamnose reductase